MDSEGATIRALRGDLALQIARFVRSQALTQIEAARRLSIPQPTVSKIMNGKVSELSLELLIRVAVRAGLPVVLQTGQVPEEAGVFLSEAGHVRLGRQSRVADEARDALLEAARQLTPEARLQAHVRHSELIAAFHRAGRTAVVARGNRRTPVRRRSS